MVGGSVALLLTARQSSTDVSMTMLWTLFVVLLVLWLLGVVSSYTLRWIHPPAACARGRRRAGAAHYGADEPCDKALARTRDRTSGIRASGFSRRQGSVGGGGGNSMDTYTETVESIARRDVVGFRVWCGDRRRGWAARR